MLSRETIQNAFIDLFLILPVFRLTLFILYHAPYIQALVPTCHARVITSFEIHFFPNNQHLHSNRLSSSQYLL